MLPINTVLISRTDGIGDVVLTLPVAGVIKKSFPECRVVFLASGAAVAVAQACVHVDRVIDWHAVAHGSQIERSVAIAEAGADALVHVYPNPAVASAAWLADIPEVVGTNRRLFHWRYCNLLVSLSRTRSRLHEAQLNMRLLAPLGLQSDITRERIADYFGLTRIAAVPRWLSDLATGDRFNLVLHPRSNGSAREWGLDRFSELIRLLPEERYRLFITGTAQEGNAIRSFLDEHALRAVDLTGRLSITELISFLSIADGIVAASTGPLHLAAAMGKVAVGLYAPIRPIWPTRWGPLGPRAHALTIDKPGCRACRTGGACACIRAIDPVLVAETIERERAAAPQNGLQQP